MIETIYMTVGKLSVEQVTDLINKGLIYQPEELPDANKIKRFMKMYSHYTAQGYVLAPSCKVVLTGVMKGKKTKNKQEIKDFMELFKAATIIDFDHMIGQYDWDVNISY